MSDRMTHGIPARFSHFMNTYVEHAEISIYELPPNATSLENAVGLSDMSASVDMSLRGMLEEAVPRTYFGAGLLLNLLLLLWFDLMI